MPVRVCWVADDDDESAFAGAAEPELRVEWHRVVPPLSDLGRYDVLVADPGALRVPPDELERRVHEELPSLPIVFYSGLRAEHHARGGVVLDWSLPSLVAWISHGEAPLATELPRRLLRFARGSAGA